MVDGMQTSRRRKRSDRLDELTFELPLAGGDRPCGAISMVDVARGPSQEPPVAMIPSVRLRRPARGPGCSPGSVRGIPDREHRPRLPLRRSAVSPSSTTRRTAWHPPAVELSAWHYRPEALGSRDAPGPLPAPGILYTVALHRYMRWRDPCYDARQRPRRRALSVRSGHEQPGIPDRRRRRRAGSGRGVRPPAGGGAERPLRPGRRQ